MGPAEGDQGAAPWLKPYGEDGPRWLKNPRAAALKLQRNWRRFQAKGRRLLGGWCEAQLQVKQMVYEKMELLRLKRLDVLKAKLQDSAVVVLQRQGPWHLSRRGIRGLGRKQELAAARRCAERLGGAEGEGRRG